MKFLFLLLIAINTYAALFEELSMGIGQFYEMPNQTEKSESEIMQLSPMLSLKSFRNLGENFFLAPEISWVIYQPGENASSNQNIFLLGLNAGQRLNENFKYSLGFILNINSTSGDGSEETLPNGDSETEYFAPAQRSNSYTMNLAFNLEYFFDEYSFATNAYTYKILNNEEREYSLAFTFNKYFELGD